VADVFVSYTSSDREWAFWIGQQLEKLGHVAHIHEWEIDAGGNIAAWMQERHDKADHTLCVVSKAYLSQPYSSWELQAAQWAAARERPNFVLPVFVEDCKAPTLLAPFKCCDLFGLNEDEASARLEAYLKPAAKPSEPAQFPGGGEPVKTLLRRPEEVVFPGSRNTPSTASTVPISGARDFPDHSNALAARGNKSDTSQTIKGTSSLLHEESAPRLIVIGAAAICALVIIVWLLSSLPFRTSVKTGDCGIANSGTVTGSPVNCGPPPAAPAAKP
jgi:hypothetical protein